MSTHMETFLPEAPVQGTRPAPDDVRFWRTGAQVIGTFCCAACGRPLAGTGRGVGCTRCGLASTTGSTRPGGGAMRAEGVDAAEGADAAEAAGASFKVFF